MTISTLITDRTFVNLNLKQNGVVILIPSNVS